MYTVWSSSAQDRRQTSPGRVQVRHSPSCSSPLVLEHVEPRSDERLECLARLRVVGLKQCSSRPHSLPLQVVTAASRTDGAIFGFILSPLVTPTPTPSVSGSHGGNGERARYDLGRVGLIGPSEGRSRWPLSASANSPSHDYPPSNASSLLLQSLS